MTREGADITEAASRRGADAKSYRRGKDSFRGTSPPGPTVGQASRLSPLAREGEARRRNRHPFRTRAARGSGFGFDRITFDRSILGGKACIRGMRISVSLLVNLVANGMTTDEILEEYPTLEPEDVKQALQYAAWTADDQLIPVSESA